MVLAFALNLSAFTTQALMIDFDRTPAEVGVLTADILKAVVHRGVDAQISPPAMPAGEEGVDGRAVRTPKLVCLRALTARGSLLPLVDDLEVVKGRNAFDETPELLRQRIGLR